MGCTPSIHVSQTGVVYCRDSDESNSPQGSSNQAHAAASHCVSKLDYSGSGPDGCTHGGVRSISSRRATISITEAETQTSVSAMKGVDNEVLFGSIPMKIKQHTMSVMLVFAREDSQSDGFWWAADRGGYACNLLHTTQEALDCYRDKRHDVVVIDNRQQSVALDAESLCRSIRGMKSSEHTIMLAVNKKLDPDKEETSILPLLNAGFDKRFLEDSRISVCLNELMSIERHNLQMQIKLRAANAMATALQLCNEAVEITNETHQVQFVNPMYERLTGFSSEDVLGRDVRETTKIVRQDNDSITTQLKKGKSWEGVYFMRQKSGDSHPYHCVVSPVLGQAGKSRHFVSVYRNSNQEVAHVLDKFSAADLTQLTNGGIHNSFPRRRDSMARIHSMTIEAPINKVMHIITAAQENSPITVVRDLDRVLDILRTTELYSPPSLATQQVQEEDQMTNDLVGGLMTTQGLKRRYSSQDVGVSRSSHPHSIHNSSHVAPQNQMSPEIAAVLEKEALWDFDILELERVTNKRPLMYLGFKTFQRFDVMAYLQVTDTVMHNWLQMVESNYHTSNSYHNSSHAADVMHATAFFLERDRIKAIFDQMDEVAALIAAVIHDLDHPGKTNSFLINAHHQLAVLYNDLAVLENHHSSVAFQLTARDSRVDIFKNLSKEDYRFMREQIIDMVMATEMSKHFQHLTKFTSCVNHRGSGVKVTDDSSSLSGKSSPESHTSLSHLTTADNRMVIKRMMIKCADVSNPTRSLKLCKEWATRIVNEYFQQTDEEINQGLPVTMPVFDRKTCNFPNSQVKFIEIFINEMFDAWDALVDVPELMTYLQNNYKYWKSQEEQLAAAQQKDKTQTSANESADGQG